MKKHNEVKQHPIQLELNFPREISNVDFAIENVTNVPIKLQYKSSNARVINICEIQEEIDKIKEQEIISYIISHSKSF